MARRSRGKERPLTPQGLADLLLYPKPADIKEICTLIDLFRDAQIAYLRRAQEIDQAVSEVMGDPGGEEIRSEQGLHDFRRGDQVFLEGRSPHFETSSLVYARSSMVFSDQVGGEIEDCLTGAAEEVLTGFWKGARHLTVIEYMTLSPLAKRPPRYEVDIEELERRLREVAARLGLLREPGQ